MAEDASNITTSRLRRFDEAVRAKWNRYTGSGVATIIAGLIVLILTTAFVQLDNTSSILLFGLGILFIIIGIVRFLIGIINPATPQDIEPIPAEETATDIQHDSPIPVDPGSE